MRTAMLLCIALLGFMPSWSKESVPLAPGCVLSVVMAGVREGAFLPTCLKEEPDIAYVYCVVLNRVWQRNDEWQAGGGLGNFSSRLVSSISAFIFHAERLLLPLQVVVVDYNPPPDSPSLERQFFAQAVGIPPQEWWYSTLTFVTVPSAVHSQIQSLPTWQRYRAHFLEYVAKNVGLRAARCNFSLVTNPDIVPGRELMHFLEGLKGSG